MVENALKTIAPAIGAEETVRALEEVRARTLALVAHLPVADLERVHSPLMSPLTWDLAHIAAYEDLWLVHRHVGRPLLRGDLAGVYDAFETPRAVRGEVELLDAPQTFEYMDEVRRRTVQAIGQSGIGDGFLHELVLRHELQHTETMLQTMALAGLLPEGLPPNADRARAPGAGEDGRAAGEGGRAAGEGGRAAEAEWVEIEAGTFEMGASGGSFAYDNELPRHAVELGAFRIAREPVSCSEWVEFEREGGYERSELWSQQGWSWRQSLRSARHPADGERDGDPVCHVSFHEAEAFARFRGARLPSEAEWERAAGGADPALRGVGAVWEWTGSELDGYPGFIAHPYREYSEVFFGKGYRVLRGGSWATHERVATATFRNWDLPERRQIFAGLRLAADMAGR